MVGITFPPTHTPKRFAVSVPNSAADRARFGSVSGRNSYQLNPKFQALISQENTQLIERPTIGSASFFSSTWLLIQVISDASQIFYGYYFFVISSRLDNAITNRVVEPSLKSSFLTRDFGRNHSPRNSLARQPFQESSAPGRENSSCLY